MRLGIDASNLRQGGGVTHLVELLRAADPPNYGFNQVVVWGGRATLDRIANRPWLIKVHQRMLDNRLPCRVFWQVFRLSEEVRLWGCEVLLVPGGSYAGNFRPLVTMSRNLLPFERREMRRYGVSWMTLKLILLRQVQSRTFRRADGLIFLTSHARETVMKKIQKSVGVTSIIPHGMDERFFRVPRQQKPVESYSFDHPFRMLYVSIIDMYKHQWHLAEAVASLRSKGYPVILDLVGPAYSPAFKRLKRRLRAVDPRESFIRYRGAIAHEKLPDLYGEADLCVFASSCENMPNILLEGMASGLPMASSRREPMPEILGDGGIYFDPEKPVEIEEALRYLIEEPEIRDSFAGKAYEKARQYSWKRCAEETFSFLAQVARNHNAGKQ
jgi:glycosyltransferase involved in cell wall biosynthesis